MYASIVERLGTGLREARRLRGLSIAALAEQAGVSARLVCEFELGKRPHISLQTAVSLLELVGSPLVDALAGVRAPSGADDEAVARAARAAHRRATWTSHKSAFPDMPAPAVPDTPETRLSAAAAASRLAVGLQAAARRDGPEK